MIRLLDAIATLSLTRPRWVIAGGALLLVVCAALAATLRIDSSRHTMVADDNPHQALQAAYTERFGLPDTMIFVLSGGDVDARQALADALHDGLQPLPDLAGRVLARVTPETMAEVLFLQPRFARPDGLDEQGYLQHPDGHQHYVLLFPTIEGTQQTHEVLPIVTAIRAARDNVLAATPAPHGGGEPLRADLTGAAPLVVDEQREIQRGILVTSTATGGAILLLLFVAFRSVRFTLLAVLPVAIGVTATMAVARLVYGDLNMVTSSCSSILLGLGIDSGVFLLSRYGELLRGGLTRQEAIRQTVRRSGLALIVGAVTTAVAFLTTTTTEFTAYARLGVIVAVGLVTMVVASLVLLPALLQEFGGSETTPPPALKGIGWLPGLVRRAPRLWVAIGLLGVVLSLSGVGRLTFNTRFYDFIPPEVESARALLAIETDTQVSPLRATVPVEGIEEARAMTEALRALSSVAAVQSPTDALPPLDLEYIQLRASFALPADATPTIRRAWTSARRIVERGAYLPTDLPPILQHQFVSRDGQAVGLQVIPGGNIWDPEVARTFAQQVSSVAPNATGMAMHIHAHLRFIQDGFQRAALLAALLMLLVVSLAFRSLRDGALALLPCAAGFVWMVGAMAWGQLPFDAANIVVLPLILGIGVDAGVHLVERVRQSEREHGVARLQEIVLGTGSAVVVATVTTLVGFAALMLADYGAMQSLGRVMTLGVGACLVAAVVLLPAVLVVTGRAR